MGSASGAVSPPGEAASGLVNPPAHAAAVTVHEPAVAQASAATLKLADLTTGAEARVVAVGSADSNPSADLARRLAELGFLPGEKLRIVARGLLGREPIAVRIGTGTFALRLFEAACIRVCPEQPQLR
jgi:ferrous iron transport protein A